MSTHFREPWFIRRAMYLAVSVIMLVLTGVGVVSVEQGDKIIEQILSISTPIIAFIATAVAAKNTDRSSDVRNTKKLEKKIDQLAGALQSPSETSEVESFGFLANTSPDLEEPNTIESDEAQDPGLPVYQGVTTA